MNLLPISAHSTTAIGRLLPLDSVDFQGPERPLPVKADTEIGESCRAIEFEHPTVIEIPNQKIISWVFLGR